MRTPVFQRPKNDFSIMRLATGQAIVRLYAAYVETPEACAPLTANVVEMKVPDMPDLEMDVLHRFSFYYNKAAAEEIKYLTQQYKKVVCAAIAKSPPGKKEKIIDKADSMIHAIAYGDKGFITQQEFAKMLKHFI